MWGATAYSLFTPTNRGGRAAPWVLRRYKKGRAVVLPAVLLSAGKRTAQSLLLPQRFCAAECLGEVFGVPGITAVLLEKLSYLMEELSWECCRDLGSAKPASYPGKDDAETKQTNKQLSNEYWDLTFYYFIYYQSKITQPRENPVIKAMGLKFRLQILPTENRLKCKHLINTLNTSM